ncbi:sensor histidine kinase [Georgenia sp. MJ170]|uniref:sensor histidine kinase n=1 Tax=Georgenia sunbinii TaxID=3117728 RepID=UPI002F2629E9
MEILDRLWRTRVRATERSRDVSDAVLTFAGGAALVAVGVVETWGAVPGAVTTSRWLFLLPLAAICAVMLVKRRHPVPALAAGGLIFAADYAIGGSLGVMLAMFDLIYAAALYAAAPWVRRLEVGVAVVVPATTAAVFVATGDLRSSVVLGILVFAMLGTPLWWGRSVRQQVELTRMAAARAGDLERLAQLRQEEVVREERTRMARDLHDALAGQLSTIAIHAEGILAVPQADPARRDQGVRAIRTASVASLREMRSMIGLLRTGEDAATSPARLAELDSLVTQVGAQGRPVALAVTAPLPTLPAAVDQAAYRITQEALTNELKHGADGEVSVRVTPSPQLLTVEVLGAPSAGPAPTSPATTPDGVSAGIGLVTMRERAEALGGTFTAGWHGPSGSSRWRVLATIPLEEPA